MIKVKNLNYYINGKPILEDINFEVSKGDFLAIIGPNGGGKSTLIRCLLGFIKPQKGEIFLWDKKLKDFKDWFKIGYVPQRAGKELNSLTPLTVLEFLHLPSSWYRKKIDRTYLHFLVEKFGLTSLLSKKIYHLSFGQLQRAYIVRALTLNPELLILDEPSVGLDFILQEVFYQFLSEFHQRGLTIILITHETWLVSKEVNKIACLNQKLYFHGEHKDFCIFAENEAYGFPFHRIEHRHW